MLDVTLQVAGLAQRSAHAFKGLATFVAFVTRPAGVNVAQKDRSCCTSVWDFEKWWKAASADDTSRDASTWLNASCHVD